MAYSVGSVVKVAVEGLMGTFHHKRGVVRRVDSHGGEVVTVLVRVYFGKGQSMDLPYMPEDLR